MLKLSTFLFICLYVFSLGRYNIDIVEGTLSYTFEPHTEYYFTFNAIDNGIYVIIFPSQFKLLEATGEINEDVDFDYGFYSYVYSQNFKKGDYITLSYPNTIYPTVTTTQKIRIEKIDAYIKLKLNGNPVMFTMALNDCQKPLYIFGRYNVAFNAKIHSGKFMGSYRTTPFNPDRSIIENLTKIDISDLTPIPSSLNYHMFKLQCIEPGIISIYMIQDFDPFFTLDNIRPHYIQTGKTEYFKLLEYQPPLNIYIQGFNLVGKTSMNLTNISGNYYVDDFYDKIHMKTITNYSYIINYTRISNTSTIILTYCNLGEPNITKLEEKKDNLVKKDKMVLILIKKTNKKYIKVQSSVNKFHWDYIYSQTDDINYITPKNYSTMHYQKGNTSYIDNPYRYKSQRTNYHWFISLIHYNDEDAIFKYEYTNGEDGDNDKGSSKTWILVVVAVPLIIIIGVVAFCIIRKKRRESSNIEALVNEM